MLLNLITNAVKFSHAGGRVLLLTRFTEEGVALSVTDGGIGMDENEIATAVSRFGQVASAWSRKHPGTGLGLPLAIGLGQGSELRQPLGISIVGGLLLSQALTLYTTPVVYIYMDHFRIWLGGAWGRLMLLLRELWGSFYRRRGTKTPEATRV